MAKLRLVKPVKQKKNVKQQLRLINNLTFEFQSYRDANTGGYTFKFKIYW